MAKLQSRIIFPEGKPDNRGRRVGIPGNAGTKRGHYSQGFEGAEGVSRPLPRGKGGLLVKSVDRPRLQDTASLGRGPFRLVHSSFFFGGFRTTRLSVTEKTFGTALARVRMMVSSIWVSTAPSSVTLPFSTMI